MDRDESADPIPVVPADSPGGTASLEDLVCLQSAIDELRRERDSLIKRLQTIESGAREKLQLSESRLREALAQIDALKRTTQTARARFEADAQAAKKRAEAVERHAASADALQQANAELTTALEAAQCRVADLETESLIHQAEIERLGQELTAYGERLAGLEAEHAAQRDALTAAGAQQTELQSALSTAREQHAALEEGANSLRAERDALQTRLAETQQQSAERAAQLGSEIDALREQFARERAELDAHAGSLTEQLAAEQGTRAALEQQLDATRSAHAAELEMWQQTATQREAELVAARDDLARQVEEEQSHTILAREEAATLGERIRELEAAVHAANQRLDEATQELAAAQAEWGRERGVFEATARQRESEHQQALADLRATLQVEIEAASRRADGLAADRDAALTMSTEFEQKLSAATAEHERLRAQLDEQLGRDAAERTALLDRVAQLESAVRGREAEIAQLTGAHEQLQQQRTRELEAARASAHSRETELLAARDGLVHELDAVRADLASAQESLAAAEARNGALAEQLGAQGATADDLSKRVAALDGELHGRDARIQELVGDAEQLRRQHANELQAAAEAARAELAAARAEIEAGRAHGHTLEERLAARSVEAGALQQRIAALEADLQARAEELVQLRAESEQAREQHAAAVRAATEQAQGHEAEWRSTRENLQRELDAAREESHNRRLSIEAVNTKVRVLESQLAERDTVRKALSERIVSLEEELRQRDVRLQHLSTQVAGHSEESKVWLETAAQREAELVAARDELAARLETERVHTAAAQDQVATLAARVSELEAESADTRDRLVAQLETERAQASAASQAAADVATRVRALESELDTAREQLAAQGEAERTQAASAANQAASFTATLRELEAELSRAREAATSRDTEWRAAHDTLARDLDDARAQLSAALAARDQAGAKLQLLEEQVAAREAALGDVRGQMETASAVSREKDESLFAAEQRAAELARHLEEVQEQTVGALQAQEAMTIRLTELDHERRELLIRIDQMTALTTQLERECERLRRDRPAGEETRKLKAEFARLEAKLKEVEQQQGEAAQRHSAAVGGYMVELNQRSEALHARNLELERVTEELNLTRQTCDDALAQIEIVRQERAEIEQQLKELRAAAAGAARAATPPAPERSAPMPARPATAKVAAPATPPPSVPPTSPFSRGTVARGPLTVIHLEENKAFREPLREVLEQLPQSSYLNAPEAPAGPGARMLAVNLLNRTHDALAAITTAVKTDAEHHEVFAYCADGSNGFLFGTVDFFSQPIDPDDCVTRMLERRGSVQRLLAVSDNVEMTGALREVLSRMRCSTSVAFDSRQAIDLLPMIKPEVVLVDFALPRGEGLRLVARLRSDPKTRDLPLAVLLPANANVAEFRQHALRAAREVTMEPKQLGQSLAERLGVVPETRAKGAGLLKTG